MPNRTRVTCFAILSLALALAACGRGTPGPQTNPAPTSAVSVLASSAVPTQGTAATQGNPTQGAPTAQVNLAQTTPTRQSNPAQATPTAQSIPTQANASGAEPTTAAGGEGGGQPEGGSSLASLTDPGGLPPAPGNSDSQAGEEKMAVYRDPQGRYQILFVNT